ncbi:putative repressor protein [Enterobacter cloacae]|uniref:Putative repressor protein n=1 Tax=Enterobacter cloacae TaxID=550 RepID=A0A377M1J0_ENTCL|nr:putative repressor protein [Enterobacter cloacae]
MKNPWVKRLNPLARFDARHEELLDLFDSLAEWEKEQHMVNLRAQVNSIDNELKARLKGKSKQEILQMLKDLEID